MSDRTQNTQLPWPTGSSGSHGAIEQNAWLNDPVVTILVGAQDKRFTVHVALLTRESETFKNWFSQGRDEMRLPDEEPKIFTLFVGWLYGTAFTLSGGPRGYRFPQPDGVERTVRDYLGVYVMGFKFGITGIRNAVVDCLYTYFGTSSDDHKAPAFYDVKYIFDNTEPGAPMRRLLTAHLLFFLFSKSRRNSPLPGDWVEVLSKDAAIGFAMIQMLAEWNWVMGDNAPRMNIRPRADFHEKVPFVKYEPDEDLTEL
ncbi:uncharacterized protein B0T15DRAFT_232436 [Chaetomium strumarium]|uniref:BTB domain-containing protein n=1 Tax=Chaetomium strumarium TaxID=1170767 RepID=A0AAJ0GQB7_9PEZI|nr:hypothetical protein B0T15DRAFT_232436 [Chaetomium strumarium]